MLGKRRVRRSDSRSKKRIQWLERSLFGSSCLLLLSLIVGGFAIRNGVSERDRLRTELTVAESVLLTTTAELERLHEQTADMVIGRIPNLVALEFDRVVSFADSTVRNVIFTEVRKSGKRGYEYHAVLHNRGSASVTPSPRVLLFDEMGIQIGVGDIMLGELAPNEVTSHTGIVDLVSDETPQYFAVVTQAGMLSVE